MPDVTREAAESRISAALLAEWDPMDVRSQADQTDHYLPYAHDVYALLMRGASDTQVGRHLHAVEREQMHHPDADARDLTIVLRALRAIEKTI